MHARGDHRFVKLRDFFQGGGIIARYHFQNFSQRVFFIAGVDALRRIADVEIAQPLHAGILLQNGDANFFGGTGIDGGFVHHDRTFFHILADALAGADQRAEIGLMRFVHRCGYGDDDVIADFQRRGIGGDLQLRRGFQIVVRDFAGRVTVAFIALDFFG